MSLAHNVEVDLAVLVICLGSNICRVLQGGAETHSKTPTKSRTESETKSGTQGYQFSVLKDTGKRIG